MRILEAYVPFPYSYLFFYAQSYLNDALRVKDRDEQEQNLVPLLLDTIS